MKSLPPAVEMRVKWVRSRACSVFEIVLRFTNCTPWSRADSLLLTDCYGAFIFVIEKDKKDLLLLLGTFFQYNSPRYPSCVCCSRVCNH